MAQVTELQLYGMPGAVHSFGPKTAATVSSGFYDVTIASQQLTTATIASQQLTTITVSSQQLTDLTITFSG